MLLTWDFPYPLKDGVKLRIFHLFRHLSKRHTVSLLCIDDSHLKYCQDPELSKYFSIPNVPFKEAGISGDNFDIVYVAGKRAINGIGNFNHQRVVFDIIDDPALNLLRNIGFEKNLFRKLRLFHWWQEVRKEERSWNGRFSNFVITSPADKEALEKICPKANIEVIPNGVDATYFMAGTRNNNHCPVLVFTGLMSYNPNSDAMLYFVRKIYPLIKKNILGIKFYIVGPDYPEKLKRICQKDDSITLTGWVDDVRPYLEKATVYICPLRWGTGVKNKILEAWAMQKPIVATSASCAGLDAQDGENILMADKPKEFAAAVVRLLSDADLRDKLASKARELVETRYNWENMAKQLEGFLEKVRV